MTATTDRLVSPRTWGEIFARGMGQVFFMDRPVAGVLMLLGLAAADLWLALFTAVGILVGTLTALALRIDRNDIGAGLHGYCAALVGGAAYTTWGPTPAAWISLVVGGVVVVPVTLALAAVLRTKPVRGYGLSVLTAPFCIVSGVVALIARPLLEPAAPLAPAQLSGVAEWLGAVLTGIGQVVFADSAVAGLVILAALFVASWRAGAGALVGAVTTTVVPALVGADQTRLAHGLTQYSAVLVGIAVLAVFLPDVRPRWVPWATAVVGSLATIPVAAVLAALAVPVYTWPFILVTWVIVAATALVRSRPRARLLPRRAGQAGPSAG